MRRAASSSWVLMTPIKSPCSVPIRFLPTFAAGSREIHCAEMHAAGEVRHDSGVLVIRMGTEHQDRTHGVKAVKQFVQLGGSVQGRRLATQYAGEEKNPDRKVLPHHRLRV